jgi:hypothetical protein
MKTVEVSLPGVYGHDALNVRIVLGDGFEETYGFQRCYVHLNQTQLETLLGDAQYYAEAINDPGMDADIRATICRSAARAVPRIQKAIAELKEQS